MAELAAGVVSSLLVVIRDEARLLGGVQYDLRFIQEEMESMNSFLEYLARSAPPGGEHDGQVLTWMNQVRNLAQDCNNWIDLYLHRCDPDIHLAWGGLRRYLGRVPWFLHRLFAQHRAGRELCHLKDRARDIAERRLRYAVEAPVRLLPTSSEMAGSPALAAGAAYDVDQLAVATAAHPWGQRAVFHHPTLDDYLNAKLLEWMSGIPPNAGETFSIAIVAPDADEHVLALAQETLVAPPIGYHRSILVNIPAVHPDFAPLRPKEVLYYILWELKHANSRRPKQGIDQGGEEEDGWQVYFKKFTIYRAKKRVIHQIKEKIEKMKIYEKLDKIKSGIQVQQQKSEGYQKKQLHLSLGQNKDADQLDLDELLLLLSQSVTGAASQPNEANIISKIANKLKEHMEADENGTELKEQMGIEDKEEIAKEGDEQEKQNEMEKDAEDRKEKQNEEDKGEEAEEEIVDDDEDEEVVDDDEESLIFLHEDQYAQILQKVFTKTSSSKPLEAQRETKLEAKQAIKTVKNKWDEEEMKREILAANQEALRALQGGKQPDNDQAVPCEPLKNPMDGFEGIAQKIEQIKQELKEQLKIKGIVDKINYHLNGERPLIIFKLDQMLDVSIWEEIRKALSLLQCSAGALIFTTTESIQQAKGYCYPPREPIAYCLVGLYHDRILDVTHQQKNEDNYNPYLLCDILEACGPHEFCMKIFTHALYANPRKSNEELIKLHKTLQYSPKSFYILAKKMFMYSYNDLPEECQSCLLYLAIFPSGYKIRRSTLIGRWVAERLTFKKDWPSSVRHAHQCFDALICRGLVYPADIGATGKVKSCVVGDLIHGFITPIARKKHFLEARLSHHLARHFSVFNDLQLRSSDRIDKIFQRLSEASRVSLLKVLDLEGCWCFGGKNQWYLKVICSKMLLLKYLSLRGTNITHLPSEVNCLRELEVLDIRETKLHVYATRKILLFKLKRLLAGNIDPTPSNFVTSVQIPRRIYKMVDIEVLSNVKSQNGYDLKDVGKLWQLRKLGVVINEDHHLSHLLRTISDLHECLRSLTITLPVATTHEGTLKTVELPEIISFRLTSRPKILESLSISGTTLQVQCHLLPLLIRGDSNTLAKLTLSRTLLDQNDLCMLAHLPTLRCVRLQHIACTEPMLTFKKDEFVRLKYLLVEGSNLTNITFKDGAAHELEKMVLSFTSTVSISGVDKPQKLEEVKLNNSFCGRLLSSFDDAKQIAKLTLCGTLLEQDALQILSNKPNIRCLVLLDKSFDGTQNQITFNKHEFIWLNLLVVDCSTITEIVFATGSAPRLEKIIWSSPTSLSGINNLPRLKELEFNGDLVPNVEEIIKNYKYKLEIKHNKPETQDQAKEDEEYDEDAGRFSLCWK